MASIMTSEEIKETAQECFKGFHGGIEPDYIGQIEFRIEQKLKEVAQKSRDEGFEEGVRKSLDQISGNNHEALLSLVKEFIGFINVTVDFHERCTEAVKQAEGKI